MQSFLPLVYTIFISFVLCFQVRNEMQNVPAIQHAQNVSTLYAAHLRECRNVSGHDQISRAQLWSTYASIFYDGALPISVWQNKTCFTEIPIHWMIVRKKAETSRTKLCLLSIGVSLHILQLGSLQVLLYAVFLFDLNSFEQGARLSYFIVTTGILVFLGLRVFYGNFWSNWVIFIIGILFFAIQLLGVTLLDLVRAVLSGTLVLVGLLISAPAIPFVGTLLLFPWNFRDQNAKKNQKATIWRHSTLAAAKQSLEFSGMIVDHRLEYDWNKAHCPKIWLMDKQEYSVGTVVVMRKGVLIAM